ncbi:MAG TPA: MFS transporter [Gaiellaceae bacterium]|nr:MFS transporter [Gaiellaceae bacterium]
MTEFPVRRNTLLLAAAMAVNSASLQLVAAVSALTFVLVTGFSGLLGLGPAVFLVSGATTALVAGRAMDRVGRIPVLATGFALGAAGAWLTALSLHLLVAPLTILGFALMGAAAASVNLSRAAAGDMYPRERRARGIAWVLFGAVFGAILGPAVFSPLFAGRAVEAGALVVPWLGGGTLALVGLLIVLFVRPDPKRIAEALRNVDDPPDGPAAPLAEILRRPGAVPALLAGLVSFAVMVAVMNLTGYVVVEHHHHPQHLVFPIIGAHVLGMYALAPVIGTIIDRLGRTPALVGGLGVVSVSCAGLVWAEAVWPTAVLLFGLGVGWNFSFVAATAQLADLAAPAERGKLLGFHDLSAGLLGATLVLLGGWVLDAVGVYALASGAAAVALVPVALIILFGRAPHPEERPAPAG